MYQFSRAIYRELAAEIAERVTGAPRPTEQGVEIAARQRSLWPFKA